MYQEKQGPPIEPLLVVLGSTGTGKSDFAVELARQFDGEVINADAMQLYHGLPVTTNKISEAEQRGVPHHLLGVIGLEEEPWQVGRFKQEATRIISEIRSRGRIPIVAGGSQYYTDGLLFEKNLVDEPVLGEDASGQIGGAATAGSGSTHPILDGPTEGILAKLREVDPAMAAYWHPNDRRKIQRSLEIYLTTGKRASDIYAQQKREKSEKQLAIQNSGDATKAAGPTSPNYLLFWVYSDRDVLNTRLKTRIDTMLSRGLLEEVKEMHSVLESCRDRGIIVDRTKGIWQSIGFKEMEPYLSALKEAKGSSGKAEGSAEDAHDRLDKLRTAGLESMTFATQRYSRHQLRWIKHKTISMLADEDALDRLYLVDSTDKEKWHENVAAVGVKLAATFLGRTDSAAPVDALTLPAPIEVSDTAREVLTATIAENIKGREKRSSNFNRKCEVCRITLMDEAQWHKHINSRRHARTVTKQKRRALVPVPVPVASSKTTGSSEHASDPIAG